MSVRYRVELAAPAVRDAEETCSWISEDSPQGGHRWHEGLMQAFRSLERNPLRCSLAPESVFFNEEIRQLVYGKHRILFTVKNKTVFVLRVRHGARDYLKPESETETDE
jgi:plasmid stabilization system protein ParE